MAERIFGLETEYAFTALDAKGARISPEPALSRLMDLARDLPHLCGKDSDGIFLANGGRLYVDRGNHPEVATPEVLNPWDACRYLLAGQRILAQLADQLVAKDSRTADVFLTTCNVSYGGRPTTWGCHESYCHRADLSELRRGLIAHLVSRVVFTGAGGFNNRTAGLEFMLSPRVAHLSRICSSESQSNRGIYHDKDESLSRDVFHRLHVICGESVCSQTSAWLKVATTTLVVAMIEAGLLRDPVVQFRNPVAAMRGFALDVQCVARAPGTDGRQWTALQAQRRYLEQAEAHADHPLMPPWAPQACQRWRQMLDRLEHAPTSVTGTLDWAIKLSLYRQMANRRGIEWESLPHWNHVLVQLDKALQACGDQAAARSLSVELLATNSPAAEQVARLTPFLRAKGLSWDQFQSVLRLRQELFEVDSRFGQLNAPGIFTALEIAGVLDHRVQGVDNIEHAISNPPASGRARLRGQSVRRLYRRGSQCRCNWQGVWDFENGRFLDLADPFAQKENWCQFSEQRGAYEDPFPRFLRSTLRQAFSAYDRGHFEEAHRLLERIRPAVVGYGSRTYPPPRRELLDLRARTDFVRLGAWLQARRGFLQGELMLDEMPQSRRMSLWGILDYVSVFRFRGLAPGAEISQWIRKGLDLLAQDSACSAEATTAFNEHYGYLLMTQGRLDEARTVLQQVYRPERRTDRTMRIVCRGGAALGETHRRLGNYSRARQLLEDVRTRQTAHGSEGELVDFTLTYLAKLETDRARARAMLEEVKTVQTGLENYMGQARTLLLEARLSENHDHAASLRQRILELRQRLPALGGCRLLGKVLQRWNQWAGGELSPDETGDVFWGV